MAGYSPCLFFLAFYSLRSKRFRGAKSEKRGFRRFARAKIGARAKVRRRGWGRGRKETLADKPLDIENPCSPANGAPFLPFPPPPPILIAPFIACNSLLPNRTEKLAAMQLTFSISSENLMQSRLGELGYQSIDIGGADGCLFFSTRAR